MDNIQLNAILFKFRDDYLDYEFGYVDPDNGKYFFRDGYVNYSNKLTIKEPGKVYNNSLYFLRNEEWSKISFKQLKYKALKIFQTYYNQELHMLEKKIDKCVGIERKINIYLKDYYTEEE